MTLVTGSIRRNKVCTVHNYINKTETGTKSKLQQPMGEMEFGISTTLSCSAVRVSRLASQLIFIQLFSTKLIFTCTLFPDASTGTV